MANKEDKIADIPVSIEQEDKFQRYGFSKRIAHTIINRKSTDSIVIGLYGNWGEGKTSVLNFIEKELSYHEDILSIKFNPWKYSDENTLLVSFFNTLAHSIQTILPVPKDEKKGRNWEWWGKKRRQNPLKTDSEVLGDLFQEYGEIFSIFNLGGTVSTMGKAFSHVQIETLKERIEKLLKSAQKRLVVFIDDIDRLDKEEIQLVFKLVKLTGNFKFTTYLLAFDKDMVASAIGERFGSGGSSAGLNFLEKIIQIPLTLPLAQRPALRRYCFEFIEQALNSAEINLTSAEYSRFEENFNNSILIRLTTPRLAVRYGNTLNFSIPLLKGEVNVADLMLMEAIKTFYNEHYQFIKDYPEFFIQSYQTIKIDDPEYDKKQKFKTRLDELNYELDDNERAAIKSLLVELFPYLKTVYSNYYYQQTHFDRWYKGRRICSPDYFDRYFSYTVIEGDISDIAFDELVTQITRVPTDNGIKIIQDFTNDANRDLFIYKLRTKLIDIESFAAKKIGLIIANLGHLFSEVKAPYFTSLLYQTSKLLVGLVEAQYDSGERHQFINRLIETAEPFSFAIEIFRASRDQGDENEKLFNDEQFKESAILLKERALKESGETSVFNKFPNEAYLIFEYWSSLINKQEFREYIESYIYHDGQLMADFMKAIIPIYYSSVKSGVHRGDFKKEQYDWLDEVFDTNDLYGKVIETFGEDLIDEKIKFTEPDHNQTDENVLKQFVYWHNHRQEIPTTEHQMTQKSLREFVDTSTLVAQIEELVANNLEIPIEGIAKTKLLLKGLRYHQITSIHQLKQTLSKNRKVLVAFVSDWIKEDPVIRKGISLFVLGHLLSAKSYDEKSVQKYLQENEMGANYKKDATRIIDTLKRVERSN